MWDQLRSRLGVKRRMGCVCIGRCISYSLYLREDGAACIKHGARTLTVIPEVSVDGITTPTTFDLHHGRPRRRYPVLKPIRMECSCILGRPAAPDNPPRDRPRCSHLSLTPQCPSLPAIAKTTQVATIPCLSCYTQLKGNSKILCSVEGMSKAVIVWYQISDPWLP